MAAGPTWCGRDTATTALPMVSSTDVVLPAAGVSGAAPWPRRAGSSRRSCCAPPIEPFTGARRGPRSWPAGRAASASCRWVGRWRSPWPRRAPGARRVCSERFAVVPRGRSVGVSGCVGGPQVSGVFALRPSGAVSDDPYSGDRTAQPRAPLARGTRRGLHRMGVPHGAKVPRSMRRPRHWDPAPRRAPYPHRPFGMGHGR